MAAYFSHTSLVMNGGSITCSKRSERARTDTRRCEHLGTDHHVESLHIHQRRRSEQARAAGGVAYVLERGVELQRAVEVVENISGMRVPLPVELCAA